MQDTFRAIPRLHRAVIAGDLQTVRTLLKNDPKSCEERDSFGLKAVDVARFLGKIKFVALLQRGWTISCPELCCAKEPIERKLQEARRYQFTESLFKEYFGAEYWPYPIFESYEALQWAIGHTPWLYRSLNRWLPLVYESPEIDQKIERGEEAPSSIGWVDEKIGYGLRAESDYSSEQWIALYAGNLCIQKFSYKFLLNKRKSSQPENSQQDSFLSNYRLEYPLVWWSRARAWIDAKHIGNRSRFINHSKEPNVQVVPVRYCGIIFPALITCKAVSKREWLTLNYMGG